MFYSRAFSRSVGFGILMHNADKGGTGGSSTPPTVAELTQKVKDLDAEKLKLTKERDEANQAKDAAVSAQQKAEGERDEANTAKDGAIAAQQKAEGERDQAKKDKDTAEQAKTKAEEDLKTSDDRAEQKLRELDAKNGGTLPPKNPGAGDHTVDQEADKNLSPAQRLAATIKIA